VALQAARDSTLDVSSRKSVVTSLSRTANIILSQVIACVFFGGGVSQFLTADGLRGQAHRHMARVEQLEELEQQGILHLDALPNTIVKEADHAIVKGSIPSTIAAFVLFVLAFLAQMVVFYYALTGGNRMS
jgi:hypothetical protein